MHLLSLHRCRSDLALQQVLRSSTVGVTIGNFDGIHLGHQELFATLFNSLAGSKKPFRVLMSFIPHPRRALSSIPAAELKQDPRFFRLSTPRRKLQLAERLGFDAVFYLRFNSEIQGYSPQQFVEEVLHKALCASLVVVGDDWRFGKGRQGTSETLCEIAKGFSMETKIVDEVGIDGARVSSSRVRAALQEGHLQELTHLLGRRFGIFEKVVHGEKRGRTLGYPTANLNVRQQVLPPDGVYAGVARVGGAVYRAAISLGVRPMFHTSGERLLEVHLLDFPWRELYGQLLEVEFVEMVRKQSCFSDVEELRKQMADDVRQIREMVDSTLLDEFYSTAVAEVDTASPR